MDALNYNPYPLIYPLPEKHKPFEQKIPAYNRDYPTPAKGVLTGGAKIKCCRYVKFSYFWHRNSNFYCHNSL